MQKNIGKKIKQLLAKLSNCIAVTMFPNLNSKKAGLRGPTGEALGGGWPRRHGLEQEGFDFTLGPRPVRYRTLYQLQYKLLATEITRVVQH